MKTDFYIILSQNNRRRAFLGLNSYALLLKALIEMFTRCLLSFYTENQDILVLKIFHAQQLYKTTISSVYSLS